MKKKLLTFSILAVASLMALAGCNHNNGGGGNGDKPIGGDDPDIPVVDPVSNTLDKALVKDYSNCTTYTQEIYLEEGELEASEYDTEVLYYGGYAIVYDEFLAQMGYPAYYYYHDYNGRNYMYFDGDESQGERDGWLKENASGTDLALENTAFYLPTFLKEIDPKKAESIGGTYFITDEAEVARLNRTVFMGCWYNDIQSVAIILDGDGYVSKIYGYEEEDNDKEFVVVTVGRIGSTLFDESKLPTAPNENNVLEFWQYKGWPGPEMRIYPTSARIWANDPADRVDVRKMDIEESYRVEYELEWPNEDGQYHYVRRDSVSWVSSNPNVAKVESKRFTEPQLDKFGRNVYVTNDGDWVAKDEETGKYYRPDYEGAENEIDVTGKTLTVKTTDVYHKVITAVGEGEATITLIASSERDDKELNVSPKYGVKSNELKVKVGGLEDIDKTNAVYNFQFVGIDDETKEVYANNLVSGKETVPYTITNNGATLGDNQNSELFNGSGYNMYFAPSTNMSAVAALDFDFDDQQVSSIAFYYGYWMANDKNGTKPNKVQIRTSNDGENWTEKDITNEIVNNISGINKKLCVVEFEPASKVEIYTYVYNIGGTYSWKMVAQDMTFSANGSCHNHEDVAPVVDVEEIIINGSSSVRLGNTITFSSVVRPNNATDKTLTWSSSNTDVAVINSNGELTPVSEGKTTITATSKDGKVTSNAIEVTVLGELTLPTAYNGYYADDFYFPSYEATFNSETKTLVFKKDSYSATLTLADAESRSYTFTNASGDKIVANFENEGASFYVSTSSTSKLNGSYLAGNIELFKKIEVSSLSINVSGMTPNTDGKYEILKGKNVVCTTSSMPKNANYGKEVKWTVSNDNGAYNADFSRFEANKVGEVTLTATSEDVSSVSTSVTFVITEPVKSTSIEITGAEDGVEIAKGTKLQLGYNLLPADVSEASIKWSSSDTDVATVSGGLITAKAIGEAVITVTDENGSGSVTDSITIKVVEASGSATLPTELVGSFEGAYGEYLEITEDGLELCDLYSGFVAASFTGEFGDNRNGNPSYRFENTEIGFVCDVTIYNDTIELYVVQDDEETITCLDDYFIFNLY